ncbi:hypothetical protein CSUI_009939 [Cystoisospora suis]|uniref:Transmembrane protein n=1 Tax=Cystoisospora suis TaxID=483139 RepID=A0A2C6K0R2_9APIC|nr:hypothetical protein CSUI_009939 [Cystoisospora suis]
MNIKVYNSSKNSKENSKPKKRKVKELSFFLCFFLIKVSLPFVCLIVNCVCISFIFSRSVSLSSSRSVSVVDPVEEEQDFLPLFPLRYVEILLSCFMPIRLSVD